MQSALIAILAATVAVSGAHSAGCDEVVGLISQNYFDGQPFDFDALNTLIEGQTGTLRTSSSRSLQAGKGLRHLTRFGRVALDGTAPRLFIGISKQAGEGEIQIWNAEKSRYDFCILKDAPETKRAVVTEAGRELCLTCHQHGGAIFTPDRWSEFGRVGPGTIQGGPISFDNDVRAAARLLQLVQVCQTLCPADDGSEAVACRQALGGLPEATGAELEASLATLVNRWPNDGFAYPSSVIPDREILAGGKFQAVQRQSLTGAGDLTFVESIATSRDFLTDQQGRTVFKNVKLSPEESVAYADPKRMRPRVSAISRVDARAYLLKHAGACQNLRRSGVVDVPATRPATQPTTAPVPGEASELFRASCGGCHGGAGMLPLPLDLAGLRAYRAQGETYKGLSVHDLVDKGLMPPPGTGAARRLDPATREAMKQALLDDSITKKSSARDRLPSESRKATRRRVPQNP